MDIDRWRARLTPLGIWAPTDFQPTERVVDEVQRIEALGYSALWVPETMGRDPFAHLGYLAARTSTLVLATGISSLHHRHPGAMRQAVDTLAEASGGRFVHGIGVSHAPFVEGVRGLTYDRPLATMRHYLDAMDAAPFMAVSPAEPAPRLLAALGPKMLALAAERADGALPYWTTPEHTAIARAALGADRLLCVEQKVVLTDDADEARGTAAGALAVYADLPNYRNSWRRLGFADDDIEARAPSFVDALVAWGDAERIRQRIREHLDAGADHVCIQALTPGQPFRIDDRAIEALAPSS